MPLSLGIASAAGSLKDTTQPELLGYKVNYIPNPSFEVDASGWNAVGSAVLNVSTDESFSGSSSLSVLNTSFSGIELSDRVPFRAGEGNYAASVYIKLSEGTLEANYYMRYLQYETAVSGGTVTTGNIGTQSLSYTGSWVRLTGIIPKSGPAGFFSLRILTDSTTFGDTFFVDAVMVEKAESAGDYFDGSTPGGFWTGTPHNSYSGGTTY